MKVLVIIMCLTTLGLSAQSKKVTSSVDVTGQEILNLEFTFASNITFKIWDKEEVLVEVEVEIFSGKYNDIFTLYTNKSSSRISVKMDEDMWDKIPKEEKREWNCRDMSRLDYTVYVPKNLKIKANTISGNFEFEYFETEMNLNTISGAIDITVPEKSGLDFKAKTISGEVYSDIEIEYPYGKEGLRQVVGQDFRGRINTGGIESIFETISGNIYLRKG